MVHYYCVNFLREHRTYVTQINEKLKTNEKRFNFQNINLLKRKVVMKISILQCSNIYLNIKAKKIFTFLMQRFIATAEIIIHSV